LCLEHVYLSDGFSVSSSRSRQPLHRICFRLRQRLPRTAAACTSASRRMLRRSQNHAGSAALSLAVSRVGSAT